MYILYYKIFLLHFSFRTSGRFNSLQEKLEAQIDWHQMEFP